MLDVATLERWYTCTECEVTWRGRDPSCWSCSSQVTVQPGAPTHTGDMSRQHPPPAVEPGYGPDPEQAAS